MNAPELVTAEEAARMLRVTGETIRRWVKERRLVATKPGGRKNSPLRITMTSVLALLKVPAEEPAHD